MKSANAAAHGRLLALLCSLTLTAASVSAQGFTPGDLYLYTGAATGISSTDGGLRHIDPLTGVNTLLVDFDGTTQGAGGAVYDPYRKRILFSATLEGASTPFRLWQTDASGATESIGFFDEKLLMMSETGDGRVYLHVDEQGGANPEPFHWIDQANRDHVLMDSSGTQPFLFPGVGNSFPWRTMIYDPATNALFLTGSGTQGPCSGASSVFTLFKLPLSADGSRVVGPITCNEFDVHIGGVEKAFDVGRLPSGDLLLFIDTNSNQTQPRILMVDPVTLGISTYASNAVGALGGGTYSSVFGQTVILDSGNDDLSAFAFGETGGLGTPLGTVPSASPMGSSGEIVTLFEVTSSSCPGAFVPFGSGLAGTGGEIPALFGTGCAAPGEVMTLNLRDVVGGSNGVLILSLTEGAAPFKGGQLYPLPILITIPFPVGGAPGVAGAGDLDLPLALPNDPVISGAKLIFQGAFVDGAAPANVSLTQGLRIEIG